ncbi:MAG: hypothetical protein IPG43_12850 [Proteobacteria bacterium]|nr:hypothetical protein [Pseudomonadota bacterium]
MTMRPLRALRAMPLMALSSSVSRARRSSPSRMEIAWPATSGDAHSVMRTLRNLGHQRRTRVTRPCTRRGSSCAKSVLMVYTQAWATSSSCWL